jgi:hypothetical protein
MIKAQKILLLLFFIGGPLAYPDRPSQAQSSIPNYNSSSMGTGSPNSPKLNFAPPTKGTFVGTWECRQYIQESGDYVVRQGDGWLETYTENTYRTGNETRQFSTRALGNTPQGGKSWRLLFRNSSFEVALEYPIGNGSQSDEVLFRSTEEHVYVCNRRMS